MVRVQAPGLLAEVYKLKGPEDGACAGHRAARKGVLGTGHAARESHSACSWRTQ
jgi:hypothetical protein